MVDCNVKCLLLLLCCYCYVLLGGGVLLRGVVCCGARLRFCFVSPYALNCVEASISLLFF